MNYVGAPTGVVWMTPTNRANFEIFGYFVSLDAMERTLNSLQWSYVAPIGLDNNKKKVILCEGVVCGKS